MAAKSTTTAAALAEAFAALSVEGKPVTVRALREREQIGPRQRARKGTQIAEAKPGRGLDRHQQLLPCPFATGLRVAVDFRRRKAVA